jgi:hypothetical protein
MYVCLTLAGISSGAISFAAYFSVVALLDCQKTINGIKWTRRQQEDELILGPWNGPRAIVPRAARMLGVRKRAMCPRAREMQERDAMHRRVREMHERAAMQTLSPEERARRYQLQEEDDDGKA